MPSITVLKSPMVYKLSFLVALSLLLISCASDQPIEFNASIRPIFNKKCVSYYLGNQPFDNVRTNVCFYLCSSIFLAILKKHFEFTYLHFKRSQGSYTSRIRDYHRTLKYESKTLEGEEVK